MVQADGSPHRILSGPGTAAVLREALAAACLAAGASGGCVVLRDSARWLVITHALPAELSAALEKALHSAPDAPLPAMQSLLPVQTRVLPFADGIAGGLGLVREQAWQAWEEPLLAEQSRRLLLALETARGLLQADEARPDARRAPTPAQDVAIQRIGRTARTELQMDVAILGEFTNGLEVFRYVDAAGEVAGVLERGGSQPLEDSFCLSMSSGRIPGFISVVDDQPIAHDLCARKQFGVKSYIGAPVRLPDGRQYGALWCLSTTERPHLDSGDLRFLRALANLVAEHLGEHDSHLTQRRAVVVDLLARGGPAMVVQPIVRLSSGGLAGVEALARFDQTPDRTPEIWFAEAAGVGLQRELELAAVRTALELLPQLPPTAYIAVNVSPEIALEPELHQVLASVDPLRVVLEITEHSPVADYDALTAALAGLRRQGLRVAVDDAGAGFSSLRHVLGLAPDILKLDISLTRNIDADPRRHSLASALMAFARDLGAEVVAEGIETAGELTTLTELGVDLGQGYRLGRPGSVEAAVALPRLSNGLRPSR